MAQDMSKLKDFKNVVFSRLAADKKKSIMAFSLIALMLFMWIRVFMGDGPQETKGATQMQELKTNEKLPAAKISFIDLPEVQGRNDELTRDFFSASGWDAFPIDGKQNAKSAEVELVSGDGDKQDVKRISRELNLEAIETGAKPRVFINNKLLLMGEKLKVRDGQKLYEFEVTGIEQNEVLLRCEAVKVKLKLGELFDSTK